MRIYQLLGIVLVSLILIGATATPAPPEVEEPSATSTPGASSLEHENLDKPYLQIAEDFFAMLQEDGSEMAIEASLSTNPYMRLRQDDITMLQQQYAGAERLVGSYMGYGLQWRVAWPMRATLSSMSVNPFT